MIYRTTLDFHPESIEVASKELYDAIVLHSQIVQRHLLKQLMRLLRLYQFLLLMLLP